MAEEEVKGTHESGVDGDDSENPKDKEDTTKRYRSDERSRRSVMLTRIISNVITYMISHASVNPSHTPNLALTIEV